MVLCHFVRIPMHRSTYTIFQFQFQLRCTLSIWINMKFNAFLFIGFLSALHRKQTANSVFSIFSLFWATFSEKFCIEENRTTKALPAVMVVVASTRTVNRFGVTGQTKNSDWMQSQKADFGFNYSNFNFAHAMHPCINQEEQKKTDKSWKDTKRQTNQTAAMFYIF